MKPLHKIRIPCFVPLNPILQFASVVIYNYFVKQIFEHMLVEIITGLGVWAGTSANQQMLEGGHMHVASMIGFVMCTMYTFNLYIYIHVTMTPTSVELYGVCRM